MGKEFTKVLEQRAARGCPASQLSLSDGEHARQVGTRNVGDLQNSQSHRHFACINWPGQRDGQRQLQLINMRWLLSFMQQARWSSLDHLAFCMKDGWPSTLKDSGIVMFAKDLQPSKAPSPMAVTDSLQSDDCQRIGTCEGRVPNERHRLRDCDACQRTATFKGSHPNSRHWGMVTLAKDFQSAKAKSRMAFTDWGIVTFTELRLVVLLKDLQAQKAHIPNVCHWLGDCDAFQRNAILEGTVSNGGHWLGKAPNGRHRVRDSNACQRLTNWKGRDTTGCERLMDSDDCQRLAILQGTSPNGPPLQAPIFLREQGMLTWREPSAWIVCFVAAWTLFLE